MSPCVKCAVNGSLRLFRYHAILVTKIIFFAQVNVDKLMIYYFAGIGPDCNLI